MTATPATPAVAENDIALRIRDASAEEHRATENSAFITALMAGELSLTDYARYLAQYAWIYEALESRPSRPDDFALFDQRLRRLPSIESDLAHLGAADWRSAHPPLPSTSAYAAHLRQLVLARDDVRYLAHHYTRYLGDLSGGQIIARLLQRHYGASDAQLSFYAFDDIENLVLFKRAYRGLINEYPFAGGDVDILTAEVLLAFRANGVIFAELAG